MYLRVCGVCGTCVCVNECVCVYVWRVCVNECVEYNIYLPLSSEALAWSPPVGLVRAGWLRPLPRLAPLLLDGAAVQEVPRLRPPACVFPMSQTAGGTFSWSGEVIDKNEQVACICVCVVCVVRVYVCE